MLNGVLTGILPTAILIALGFGPGKRGIFDQRATAALAQLVVTIALPVALFPGAIPTPRSQLTCWKYIAAVAIALVGLYAVTFGLGRRLFRNRTSESTVQALTVGFPDMAFVGLPILVATLGQTAGTLPVLVGNIVTSLVIVPASGRSTSTTCSTPASA